MATITPLTPEAVPAILAQIAAHCEQRAATDMRRAGSWDELAKRITACAEDACLFLEVRKALWADLDASLKQTDGAA